MSDFKPKKFGCGRYIQEPDAYKCLAREVEFLKAKKPFVIGGKSGIAAAEDRISESLSEAKISYETEPLTTDVTYETLDKMTADLKAKGCDIVIATGGGKGMDMAKAVARRADVPIICMPSSLGTFNCWSAMSVMYTAEHKPLDRIWYENEQNCVILDTQLLAEEPVKNFASGMADCLAKYIETGFLLEEKNVNTMPADMYTSKVMAQATNDICRHTVTVSERPRHRSSRTAYSQLLRPLLSPLQPTMQIRMPFWVLQNPKAQRDARLHTGFIMRQEKCIQRSAGVTFTVRSWDSAAVRTWRCTQEASLKSKTSAVSLMPSDSRRALRRSA